MGSGSLPFLYGAVVKPNRDAARAYAERVYAAAQPRPETDKDVRVIDALDALAHVLTMFGTASGADLDDLLDMVEDAYHRVDYAQNPVVIGPVGEA